MPSDNRKKRGNRVRFKAKKYNKNSLRLSFHKSSKHLYAQIIDDNKGVTLCSASSLKEGGKKNSCNIENAKTLAAEIAKLAKENNISKIYLDRGSNRYHGIIKSFADEARSLGIVF
tara:strand:+ start:3531 stop:3878 length:348 start_codon:yes stop_codon:yes gene_type:complete